MLSLPATVRIWLCAQPTDLRKSFDSLASIVRDALGGDPLSGNIFVFETRPPTGSSSWSGKKTDMRSGTSGSRSAAFAFRPRTTGVRKSRSAPRT
jgi:hypothetical protein